LPQIIAGLDSTSPILAEAKLARATAQSAYTSHRAMPNPSLFLEGQKLTDHGTHEREQTIGIQQPLGFLWSFSSKLSSKRSLYEAEQAGYAEIRRDVSLELIATVARYSDLRQQMTFIDTLLIAADQAKSSMNARRREGDVSAYDAQRLHAELAQLHDRKRMLLTEVNQVALRFVELSGWPAEELKELTVPVIPPVPVRDSAQLIEQALANRLALKASRGRLAAAKQAVTAAKLSQLPDFSVGLGRKTSDPDWSGLVWQAEIELPLWGQRRSERNLARREVEHAQTRFEADQRKIRQEVQNAWSEWTLVQSLQGEAEDFNPEEAARNLRRGIQLYLSGEFGSLELVDALRTSLESLEVHLNLQTAALVANLELRRAAGLAILE
jgi:cobalt-zinc-cadmium efflux system outer membrane protein